MRRELRREEELVLLVAATHARRRATAARERELLERTRWDALHGILAYQGLLPLLGGRIVTAAGALAPADFAAAVRRETDASRRMASLLELATLRTSTVLEAAGIPNVPLKGPLLARALHGDPGMRQSRDVDVLVARAHLARAAEALRPLGWRHEAEPDDHPVLHVRLVHEGGLPDIELHWRLHWYETEFSVAALGRAQRAADGVRRLHGEDGLAALMLFHARDGFAGLRHPTDIAAWWDAHEPPSRDPLLEPIAQTYPGLRPALTASAALLERLVGIPAGSLVAWSARPPWRSRAAIALANPLMHGSQHQITAEVSLVDGLLAPEGERAAFVRRRALPPARDLPDSRRPLAIARAGHTLRLLGRYALGLVRPRPRATPADADRAAMHAPRWLVDARRAYASLRSGGRPGGRLYR